MKKFPLNENMYFLDTETTGLKDAECCEISIIDGLDNVIFDSLIKTINPISEEATKIHGITNEMVADAPTFANIYDQLVTLFTDKYVIIYNAQYDLRVLQYTAQISGLSPEPFIQLKTKTQCAMLWYSKFRDQPKWIKLVDGCQQMNIDITGFNAHRALADCKMTLELVRTVNSKIEIMKRGTEVIYKGKLNSHYGKVGTFNCMQPNSTVASVNSNGKNYLFDIANLHAHNESDLFAPDQPEPQPIPETVKPLVKEKEVMTTEITVAQIAQLPSVEFKIDFTLPAIKFDAETFKKSINEVLAPVKALGNNLDKKTLVDTLAKLRKFQKEISDRRIAIVKEIKQPVTDFETVIKNGDAEIDIEIAKYSAELNKIAAKENVAKQSEIEKLIPGIVLNNNLNPTYAAQLTFINDYFLAKWTLDKIKVDLVTRAEALFKQQDYERVQADLKNTQIESRTRLIEQLNSRFRFNFAYSLLPIDKFSDLEVEEYYNVEQKKRWPKDQAITITEQTEITATEIDLIPKELPPQDTVISTISQDKQASILPLVYQNLRLGGVSQMAIIRAVAKLKADGMSVEFI